MKKVLLISNSMSMPRDEVIYENTWPYLLKKELPHFHYIYMFQRAIVVSDITDIQPEKHRTKTSQVRDFLEIFKPNIVILELGITDCAPRLFSMKELKWFGRFRILKIMRWYREKYSFRKPEKSMASLSDFEIHLKDYIQRCFQLPIEKLILVPIAAGTEKFVDISPHIQKSIIAYNHIFKKLADQRVNKVFCLEPLSNEQMKTMACDIMHYNEIGHRTNKDQIAEILKVI